MKKFVVYANCQGEALARTLLENSEFAAIYEWLPLPPVQLLTAEKAQEVLAKVRQADLLLYQPVAATRKRPVELSSAFLANQVKSGGTTISFPSIYFDGYFPHLETLNRLVSILNRVHDYCIAYSCSIGLTVEETIEIIQSDSLYPKEISLQQVENSLNNLSSREEESNLDIRVSPFIRENYRREKLFNQFNHPKRSVLKHVSEKVLDILQMESPFIHESGASHLDAIVTPIYKSTHRNLQLAFAEDFTTYNGVRNATLNQDEVVKRFFDFYATQDLEEIKKHIFKTKPFVADLIDAHPVSRASGSRPAVRSRAASLGNSPS